MRFMLEKLKNKYLLSFLFGAIAVLGFAPFKLFFFSAAAICGLFVILDKKCTSKGQFFKVGFAFGFGHFLAGIYWIAISLLVDAGSFGWLIPFALTLIPSALACYVALMALCYGVFVKKFGFDKYWQKFILFSLLWVFFEVLRAVLFTGFPWNLIGYVWLFNVAPAQIANIFGTFGLSLFFVLASLSALIWFKKDRVKSDLVYALSCIVLVVSQFAYGYYYIKNNDIGNILDVNLRVVQANIKQEMKWDAYEKYNNLLKHIDLSKKDSLDDVDLLIWSESSIPYSLDEENRELLEVLKSITPKNGNLVSGALRFEFFDRKDFIISKAFNGVALLSKDGIEDFYNKHHLVPFGEYVPLQKYLPFVQKITHGSTGFSEGEGPQTLSAKKASFSPLVCYEAIFLDKIIDKNNIPDLLVAVTNDAWFGNSIGPYQHFDTAKMRSIEYGISLVRAANTGISAYVDPFGRVVKEIGLNEEGVLDIKMIKRNEDTLFLRFGHSLFGLVFIGFAILLVWSRKSKQMK